MPEREKNLVDAKRIQLNHIFGHWSSQKKWS